MDRNDTIEAKLARIALLVATDGNEDGKEVVSSKGRYKRRNLERAESEATLPPSSPPVKPVTPENVLNLFNELKKKLVANIEQNGFKEIANSSACPYFEMSIPIDEVKDSTSLKDFGMEVLFVSENNASMADGMSWTLYVKMMPNDKMGKDNNRIPNIKINQMFDCIDDKTDSGINEIQIGNHSITWCMHQHKFGIMEIDEKPFADRTISDEELKIVRGQCREMIKSNWKSWIDEVVYTASDFTDAVDKYNKQIGRP